MNLDNAILARKYAQAFMNNISGKFSEDDYKQLKIMQQFLTANRRILFFLNLSIMEVQSQKVIRYLSQQFHAADAMNRLITLISHQRRAMLVPEVLHHIGDLYERYSNSLSCAITTSHPISTDELEIITSFLKKATKKRIVYEYKQDPRLIAGISLKSDTLAWEYSVEDALNKIKQELTIRI